MSAAVCASVVGYVAMSKHRHQPTRVTTYAASPAIKTKKKFKADEGLNISWQELLRIYEEEYNEG